MHKGVIIAFVFLLLIAGVSARYYNPVYYVQKVATPVTTVKCLTNLDCYNAAKAFNGTCASGFVPDREPRCSNQLCPLCKPDQNRLRVVCRYDEDCLSKVKCSNPLNTQCAGNKCMCSTQPRVECKQDHDCVRPLYLMGNYEKLKCDHGKCVKPKPMMTLEPKYIIPANVSGYIRPHY